MFQTIYVPDGVDLVGLFVDADLAAKMLEKAVERGLNVPERPENPASDLQTYIIQLVSDDVGERL
jgi:hypothetical protein